MTLSEFGTVHPYYTTMNFFVDSGKVVKGITVSTTACGIDSTYDTLKIAESITIPSGSPLGNTSDYTFSITSREVKSGYYFYEVEDVTVSELASTVSDSNVESCTLVNFSPSTPNTTFYNSEYNPTINNISNTRVSNLYYDVDRVNNQVKPSNYDNIINGTANFAPVPDSNSTSIGFTNGRYIGTKTDEREYGIPSALSLVEFDGATYSIDKTNNSIYSQSLSERKVEQFLFAPSAEFTTADYRILTGSDNVGDVYKLPYIKRYLVASGLTQFFNQSTTTLTLTGKTPILAGDYLQLVKNSNIVWAETLTYNEYVRTTEVNYEPSTNTTTLKIERKPFASYGDKGTMFYTPGGTSATYGIFIVKGDTIYKSEGSQLYKVTNTKLYISENSTIYIIDQYGQLIYKTIAQTT